MMSIPNGAVMGPSPAGFPMNFPAQSLGGAPFSNGVVLQTSPQKMPGLLQPFGQQIQIQTFPQQQGFQQIQPQQPQQQQQIVGVGGGGFFPQNQLPQQQQQPTLLNDGQTFLQSTIIGGNPMMQQQQPQLQQFSQFPQQQQQQQQQFFQQPQPQMMFNNNNNGNFNSGGMMMPMNGFGNPSPYGHQSPAGSLAGIGVVFHPSQESRNLVVRKIIPNGPAGQSGLIDVGDVLYEIDGRDVRGRAVADVQPLIQGPEGSRVVLTLRKRTGRTVHVPLMRHWNPSAAELQHHVGGTNSPSVISQVDDVLFVGDAVSVRDLNGLMQRNIGGVINCAEECANHHQHILRYKQFMLSDAPEVDIRRVFGAACHFIDENARMGRATIVHCAAGKSRSVTVCLAYLVHRGMPLADAVTRMKQIRPWARPNSGFFKQLLRWEREQLGRNSLTSDDHGRLFPQRYR